MPSIRPGFAHHFRCASLSGLYLGILAGHVDLAVRIASLNFEWFEVYQSLLLSAIAGVVLFSVPPLLLHPLRLFKSTDTMSRFYVVLSFFLISEAVGIEVLNHLIFSGSSVFDPMELEGNLLLTMLLAALSLWAFRAKGDLIQQLLGAAKSISARWHLKDYLFLVCSFAISLFFYDLYLTSQGPIVRQKSEKQVTNKNPVNVIFLSLDTLRADHLKAYGYDRDTAPFLDKIAGESVLFEQAFSSAPWTLPSHAGIFTGKYPSDHKATFSHQKLEADQVTLAELLSASGYYTLGFVGGPYCRSKYGLNQGFQFYSDRIDFISYRQTADSFSVRRLLDFFSPALRYGILRADGEKLASEINREISHAIPALTTPYFLFINYFDVHDPYNSGEKYRALFTSDATPYEAVAGSVIANYSNPELKYKISRPRPEMPELLKALYDAEIRNLDDQLRNLFQLLEQGGKLDNTVVFIFGDHGEEFFDHGGVLHGDTLYQEMLHVPLLIYAPRLFRETRISSPVSTIDIFSTVLELTGLSAGSSDSKSFLPLLNQITPSEIRPEIRAERAARPELSESGLKAVIKNGWKLIEADPERERIPNSLFNLKSDPQERNNTYASKPEIRAEFSH